MATLVWAVPIRPGKVEAWRRLGQEMKGRRFEQYETSRQALGIAGEAAWLLRTPQADVAIIYLDVDEPERLPGRLVASEHPFDDWFKEELWHICGLDLAASTVNPPIELIFNWERKRSHE